MNITVGKRAIAEASQKLKNWGRWGKDDQIGTLNHVQPEDIVKAAALIQTGKAEPALDYQALGDAQVRAEQREERRLFYVAMTRAQERLILSGAAKLEAIGEELGNLAVTCDV